MRVIPKTKLIPEEYFEFERNSDERHDYFEGDVFATSRANRNHCLINGNIGGLLWQNFKNKNIEAYLNRTLYLPGFSRRLRRTRFSG